MSTAGSPVSTTLAPRQAFQPGRTPGHTPGWMALLPDALQALLFLCTAGTVVLAISSAVMSGYGQPPGTALQMADFLLAMPVLCLAPGIATQAAHRQMQVWQRRRVPSDGPRLSLQAWHRCMVILLALMVLPMLLIAALPLAGTHPQPLGPTLFELPLLALHFTGMAWLATAGWRGLLAPGWTLAGPLLLLEWSCRLFGVWPASDPALRLVLAAGLSMTLPLAWWLCARGLRQPPDMAAQALPAGAMPASSRWLAGWPGRMQRRWRPLDGKTSFFGALVIVSFVTPATNTLVFSATWHHQVTVLVLPELVWLCLMARPLLRAPDLHWRHLLAPGSPARRQLGWRIAADSLIGMALLWVTKTGLQTALGHALGVTQPEPWWQQAANNCIAELPVLMLATTMAVALRGVGAVNRRREQALNGALVAVVALTVVLACLAWVLHWTALEDWALSPWGRRDAKLGAVMLLLSAGMAWLGARSWSRADLAGLTTRRTAA